VDIILDVKVKFYELKIWGKTFWASCFVPTGQSASSPAIVKWSRKKRREGEEEEEDNDNDDKNDENSCCARSTIIDRVFL